jgi:transposase
MDRADLVQLLGQGLSLAEIGRRVGLHESTVGYWVAKHGLRATNRHRHAAKGGLQRTELEALVADGMSIAEIATTVGRSKATVRHWLARYDLRTTPGVRTKQRREARDARLLSITDHCRRHGETAFYLDSCGYYRCKRCRTEAVIRRRRKVKQLLVAEAGGCCQLCGYDRYVGALEFHHVDPARKSFGLSIRGLTPSIATLRVEAQKCVLLCSNCHAEVEGGLASLPA